MVLDAYYIIARGRGFRPVDGHPLPLSMRDINEYLARFPAPLDERDFVGVVFALDRVEREMA